MKNSTSLCNMQSVIQVTFDTGTMLLVAKADRVWRAEMGTLVGVKINTKRLHLFNAHTGMRVDV